MADIDVVPKRRSNWMMWLIIAVILLVVLWLVLGRGSGTPESPGSSLDPLSTPHVLSGPVASPV